MRTTHTYAVLQISREAYEEIRAKLSEAGYEDQLCMIGNQQEAIDMQGIAVTQKQKCPQCGAGLCRCDKCGREWCLDHQPNPLVCPWCGARPCCRCICCLRERDNPGELPAEMTFMVVCETCGNKRCPHATDHRLACTHSNDPGQVGSVFETCVFPKRSVP